MAKSKIEWTEETWNPVVGCTKVSPGCQNCYAERMARRLSAMGHVKYYGTIRKTGWTGRIGYDPDEVDKVQKWRKPRRVFVCSMGDLFHEKVTFLVIQGIFQVMVHFNKHTFMVLTKRPERMQKFLKSYFRKAPYAKLPSNIWIGTTVENQAMADKRIPHLLKCPAQVRFISCEPLLGSIGFKHYLPGIHWVIAGCESGPKRRHTDILWFDELLRQCQMTETPFFLKQMDRTTITQPWGTVNYGMALHKKPLVKMPMFCGSVWDQYPEVDR